MDRMESIVRATETDREAILALYKRQLGQPFCFWDEEYPGVEEISYDLSRNSLYVLKQEGHIIAAISIEEDDDVNTLECWDPSLEPAGSLARLCVHPDFQNRGLARQMMRFGLDELKRRGFKGVRFLVNKANEIAIHSYAAFDYTVVGECFMYGQNFLCYEKRL